MIHQIECWKGKLFQQQKKKRGVVKSDYVFVSVRFALTWRNSEKDKLALCANAPG